MPKKKAKKKVSKKKKVTTKITPRSDLLDRLEAERMAIISVVRNCEEFKEIEDKVDGIESNIAHLNDRLKNLDRKIKTLEDLKNLEEVTTARAIKNREALENLNRKINTAINDGVLLKTDVVKVKDRVEGIVNYSKKLDDSIGKSIVKNTMLSRRVRDHESATRVVHICLILWMIALTYLALA